MADSSAQELSQCMLALARGDRDAFAPVYRALAPRVRSMCQAMLRHEQDAEDAMQLAMEKIARRAMDYQPDRPVVPWALAIAAWECRGLQQRRRRRRESELDETAPAFMDNDLLDEDLTRRELSEMARRALTALSDADREVLVATFWESATVAGATGATLRKRRERALERLRLAFRRLYGID